MSDCSGVSSSLLAEGKRIIQIDRGPAARAVGLLLCNILALVGLHL